MKRNILLLALSFAFGIVSAETVVQIKPCTVVKGAVAMDFDYDGGAYLELTLASEQCMTNMQFDIFVPNWMTFTDKGWDYGDILPYEKQGRNSVYTHNLSMSDLTADVNEIQIPGYKHYTMILASTTNALYTEPTGGVVANLFYDTEATIIEGFYPIFITNFKVNNGGIDPMDPDFVEGESLVKASYSIGVSTSYIKIGEAADGNVNVKGVVPSFVSSALNEETAITTLDLSECTAINGDFKLVDKRGIVLPTEPTEGLEANVSYNRAFANKWGTICLPFDVQNTEAVKYYTLTAISTTDGKMTFTSVEDDEVLPAGTPAIYKSESALNLTAEKLSGAAGKSDDTDGFTPTGTFVNTTGTGLYIANNQFWSGTDFTVPAFRTYFDGDPVKGSSSQSPFRIVVDDEAAGITELEMDEKGNLHEVYNLQGQHIAAPINGQVNIIDGKKAIMK